MQTIIERLPTLCVSMQTIIERLPTLLRQYADNHCASPYTPVSVCRQLLSVSLHPCVSMQTIIGRLPTLLCQYAIIERLPTLLCQYVNNH